MILAIFCYVVENRLKDAMAPSGGVIYQVTPSIVKAHTNRLVIIETIFSTENDKIGKEPKVDLAFWLKKHYRKRPLKRKPRPLGLPLF